MRLMLRAEWSVEAGNALMKEGKLGPTVQSILEEMKPEAAYFLVSSGKRTALVFFDIQDPSQIPAVAEPWFLAVNAHIEIVPVMNADDLAKAGPDIDQAVKKYG